jgi:tRNA(Ile)-lysidine synthase
MIKIIGKIPHQVTVACSGGVDSMVVVHFLLQGKKKIDLAYFNHDTLHSRNAEHFVKTFANKHKLNLVIGRVKGNRGKKSLEEFWRDERYDFFSSIGSEFIITCHHLDDALETWLMSSFHGNPKLVPYKRYPNIYRPFLLTEKSTLRAYALRKKVDWIEDPSNNHPHFMRNYVRHNIISHVLKVNPGIRKVIRKKLINLYNK